MGLITLHGLDGALDSRLVSNAEPHPRIVIALPEGPVRDRLQALLDDRALQVASAAPAQDLNELVESADSDVVIVRRQDLTPEDRRRLDVIAKDRSSPDVVVLAPGVDEAQHVDLVAGGATDVIDITKLDGGAADAIETLAAGDGGHGAPDTGGQQPTLSDFASRTKGMNAVLDLARRVAPTDSVLLITGETGVGKEHLARAIHAASPRSDAPFVAVNCGALPEELLESELFGHAAGAFTGAQGKRKGCFQAADGGTLLLDEIAEMPRHLQVKLLRAVQRGEIRPVGADAEMQLDVRVIAATNRDLRADVEEGLFREDLYYRLNVVELTIPPLRERPADLPTLIGSIMRHFKGRVGTHDVEGLDEEALEVMLRHEWPGNVRELINTLERAVLICKGSTIGLHDLPRHLGEPRGAGAADAFDELPAELLERPWSAVRSDVVARIERTYLDAVLRGCRGVVKDAAERAGISPRSLYDKMKRHGLDKDDYR